METKFNSQICTTREQSERLLVLRLKKETADMCINDNKEFVFPCPDDVGFIPAWSLHRLIEMMPCDVEISGIWIYANRSYEFKEKNNVYDNLIDLLTSIIKEGYFNKEYLV